MTIKKIHEVMCHPKEEVLSNFFLDSSDNDDDVLEAIKEVSEQDETSTRVSLSLCFLYFVQFKLSLVLLYSPPSTPHTN